MSIVAPIHTEAVGLANLRFFAPPDGGRDFPWVALDDLYACINMPRDLRRQFKSKMRTGPWRDSIQTVATADGIANIVPHFVAQGMIDAMQHSGLGLSDFYAQYAKAGSIALSKLTDGFSSDQLLAYIAEAWKKAGGSPKDGDGA